MRILELFEDPGDPEDTPKLRPAGLPAPKKKGMDDFEPNTPFAYGSRHKMNKRIEKTRQQAKDAGFVNPDGTANTRGYLQQKSDQERKSAQQADKEYWKNNPTGKWVTNDAPRSDDTGKSSNAIVTGLVMPPKQVHPDDINAQTKRIKDISDRRDKTAKARRDLNRSSEL